MGEMVEPKPSEAPTQNRKLDNKKQHNEFYYSNTIINLKQQRSI
jgi:hypothetical protein